MTEDLSQKKTGMLKNLKKWWLIVAGIVMLAVVGGAFLLWPEKGTEGKFAVLVTAFDAPNGVKDFNVEIVNRLADEFNDNADVEFLAVNKVITGEGGNQEARELGIRRKAELVVWGKIDPDDNKAMLIQIEYLGTLGEEGKTAEGETDSTWGDWELLVFRMPVDGEVDQMTTYLAGVVAYSLGDYAGALVSFDQAVESKDGAQVVVPEEITAFQLARHVAQADAEKIIADYTRMIAVQPELASLYLHRGKVYASLEKYDEAIEDYSRRQSSWMLKIATRTTIEGWPTQNWKKMIWRWLILNW